MSKNFEETLKRISANQDTIERLKKLVTEESVYSFFKENGYIGSGKEFKEDVMGLLRELLKEQNISDEELSKVAGGAGKNLNKAAATALSLLSIAGASMPSAGAANETKKNVKRVNANNIEGQAKELMAKAKNFVNENKDAVILSSTGLGAFLGGFLLRDVAGRLWGLRHKGSVSTAQTSADINESIRIILNLVINLANEMTKISDENTFNSAKKSILDILKNYNGNTSTFIAAIQNLEYGQGAGIQLLNSELANLFKGIDLFNKEPDILRYLNDKLFSVDIFAMNLCKKYNYKSTENFGFFEKNFRSFFQTLRSSSELEDNTLQKAFTANMVTRSNTNSLEHEVGDVFKENFGLNVQDKDAATSTKIILDLLNLDKNKSRQLYVLLNLKQIAYWNKNDLKDLDGNQFTNVTTNQIISKLSCGDDSTGPIKITDIRNLLNKLNNYFQLCSSFDSITNKTGNFYYEATQEKVVKLYQFARVLPYAFLKAQIKSNLKTLELTDNDLHLGDQTWNTLRNKLSNATSGLLIDSNGENALNHFIKDTLMKGGHEGNNSSLQNTNANFWESAWNNFTDNELFKAVLQSNVSYNHFQKYIDVDWSKVPDLGPAFSNLKNAIDDLGDIQF